MFSARHRPHFFTALIAAITVVPLATLMWLGWRLLEQDRALEEQQTKQQLDYGVESVVASLQRAIAASRQRLAAGDEQWAAGAVVLAIHDEHAEVYPNKRVAYVPVAVPLREEPRATFLSAQLVERGDPLEAAGMYRHLARSPDPAIRAGALTRLGNTLAAAGRLTEALEAYTALIAIGDVSRSDVPVALVGTYARCLLLEKLNRTDELRLEASRMADDLVTGRWPVTAGVYWTYAADATRWAGAEPQGRRQAEALADAVSDLWERRVVLPSSGQESFTSGDHRLTVLWQRSDGSLRALIAGPEFVESQWLRPARLVADKQHVAFTIGDQPVKPGLDVVRRGRETDLPWNVVAASVNPAAAHEEFAARRQLQLAGFLLLVSMMLAAGWVTIRAFRKELAVATLQSDFVSAVSHEFRTPLTSLRQFTDRLREGRHLDEEGRAVCYEAQSRATDRLTRLIESLLDFGRREAGAHRYSFAEHDSATLVGGVVSDFRAEAEAAGYSVALRGNGRQTIVADRDAMTRAIWNLLDNACKYSGEHRAIEVELTGHAGDVRIAVQDHGLGIPPRERRAIFGKFHRGEEALARGIKGTGIGLAVVNDIVKAHHGRVEVESETGRGSTFTIVLPTKGEHGQNSDRRG